MKPINKAGKINPMTAIVVVALAAFLLIGLLVSGKLGGTATVTQGGQVPAQTAGASNACAYQPTVTVSGTNALVVSTQATPTTVNYIVNGKYLGTSAPAVSAGDEWTVVADLNNYLADVQTLRVACGSNKILSTPYAYADATVTVKDDSITSSNTLTNGGGANNATAANAGGQRNFPVIFQGTSQKSTGKIFWVVESPASQGINTSMMSATCNGAPLSAVAIPAGVTAANAGSYRTAFEVPAIVNGAQTVCNLQITNTATGTVKGTVLNTFYAEQAFVNANGVVETGIYDTTPNGNNAPKYQSSYSYNFVIQ